MHCFPYFVGLLKHPKVINLFLKTGDKIIFGSIPEVPKTLNWDSRTSFSVKNLSDDPYGVVISSDNK